MSSYDKVKVFRVHTQAKLPKRAHPTDAGLDFFYCPEDNINITIPPMTSALLGTGLKIEVPPACMLQVMNKSGIASKRSLVAGACVVDRGYDGEIFVNLHNIGKEPQTILPGQKVAQGVFVHISTPGLVEINEDSIYGTTTSRGAGALGSTGDR
tara:strand:+ start:156 stop:617 length:462 start_codon:yes stop_codon:yes gene_type:complete